MCFQENLYYIGCDHTVPAFINICGDAYNNNHGTPCNPFEAANTRDHLDRKCPNCDKSPENREKHNKYAADCTAANLSQLQQRAAKRKTLLEQTAAASPDEYRKVIGAMREHGAVQESVAFARPVSKAAKGPGAASGASSSSAQASNARSQPASTPQSSAARSQPQTPDSASSSRGSSSSAIQADTPRQSSLAPIVESQIFQPQSRPAQGSAASLRLPPSASTSSHRELPPPSPAPAASAPIVRDFAYEQRGRPGAPASVPRQQHQQAVEDQNENDDYYYDSQDEYEEELEHDAYESPHQEQSQAHAQTMHGALSERAPMPPQPRAAPQSSPQVQPPTHQNHPTTHTNANDTDDNDPELTRILALSRQAHTQSQTQSGALADDDDALQEILRASREDFEASIDPEQEQREMEEIMQMSRRMAEVELLEGWRKTARGGAGAGEGSSGMAQANMSGQVSAPQPKSKVEFQAEPKPEPEPESSDPSYVRQQRLTAMQRPAPNWAPNDDGNEQEKWTTNKGKGRAP